MFKKSRAPPSFHSIKSLPGDFRFMGSPTSDRLEKLSEAKLRNSDVISSCIAENGSSGDEAVEGVENRVGNMDQVNEDSPYGRNIISAEDRPSSGDEDWDSVAPPVPLISASCREHRWGDTTSYAAKKVIKVKTDKLVSANPDILDGVDDLMQLSYLNEPSVLYNLEYRYNQEMIYTKAGPVLVAINPFKKVPLYGNEYIEAYQRKTIDNPHVYAITDTAIWEMIRGVTFKYF